MHTKQGLENCVREGLKSMLPSIPSYIITSIMNPGVFPIMDYRVDSTRVLFQAGGIKRSRDFTVEV